MATCPQNGLQGKHHPIIIYGPLPDYRPNRRTHYVIVEPLPSNGSLPERKRQLRLAADIHARIADTRTFDFIYTGYKQKNGSDLKVNKKFISHLTRAQHTPSAVATVQVSHALPAVRFSCLLRGRGASFKGGVAAREGFLCAPF
jgi:hypothetical protein